MNIQQTTALLRMRRDLTGESFNDGTIEAWTEALADTDAHHVHKALIAAARIYQRVTIAHIYSHLPPRPPTPQPIEHDNRELISCDEYIRRNPNTQEARNLARHRHPTAHQP
jgi:hypothetical protein